MKKVLIIKKESINNKMKDESLSVEEIGENISETKRIANEINSLLKEFNKTNDKDEKRMISSQIEKLKSMLAKTSQKTIDSAKKVSLSKPLNKDAIASAPAIAPLASKTLPIVQLQPRKLPTTKIENLKPSSLENFTLKKMKKKKIKVIEKKEKKPSRYTNLANKYFYLFSNSLINKGKFRTLGRDLVKSNMEFVAATYVSVLFFSVLIIKSS